MNFNTSDLIAVGVLVLSIVGIGAVAKYSHDYNEERKRKLDDEPRSSSPKDI